VSERRESERKREEETDRKVCESQGRERVKDREKNLEGERDSERKRENRGINERYCEIKEKERTRGNLEREKSKTGRRVLRENDEERQINKKKG